MTDKPNYLLFRMKKENVDSLLHSMNYHKNLLESQGYRLTGAFPRFIDEIHDLLRRYEHGRLQSGRKTEERNKV
jgi:hypothetical protein